MNSTITTLVVNQHGIGRGTTEFVRAPKNAALRTLISSEHRLAVALEDEELGVELIQGLIGWMGDNGRAVAAARLDGISSADLQQFDAVLGLARLQRFCRELEANQENPDERYWQIFLDKNSWVIAQVYAIPLMLVAGQVYVGGKSVLNRGGNTIDFLFENRISGNVVLVEIKTPKTPLVASEYRNNAYKMTSEVTGAIVQLLRGKKSLVEGYRELAQGVLQSSRSLSPRGLLIAGMLDGQLSADEIESFELFRNNQRDVEIVTFDELRAKVELWSTCSRMRQLSKFTFPSPSPSTCTSP